jgi:hypothetical protein
MTGRFAMVPEELLRDETLDVKEKMILTVLYFHRNRKTWECYPGIALISRLASLSKMTVLRVLDSLEEKGIIERKRRFTRFGDYDTNAYFLRGWYQADTTQYQGDTTVVSGRDYGWYQADTQTDDLNREEKQNNPSSQKQGLDPKTQTKRERHHEDVGNVFEEFWRLYPKRQGKKAALAEFSKLFPLGMEPDQLNRRLQNIGGQVTLYADSVQGTEPKYIKNPVNWLKECDPDEDVVLEETVWVREEELE